MWSKVDEYIKKHKLLDINDLYLVALSGGADSVCLLLMLHEAGYRVHAAHCNFRLRGDESDRDEAFCVSLCERLGVELHRVHFDTRTYAGLHKVSIEMAARELRYNWFAQLSKDLGAAGVCVAHHRDDSVETVIMNLVRGTGLRGLTGIQPKVHTKGQTPCVILRPLLCVSREEIEAYLAERGQAYVTDSTNLEADVLRNKVRLQVIPLLRLLNPAAAENIQRTSENLAIAQGALDAVLSIKNIRNKLILSDFKDCALREYVTYEWLKNYGFNGSQVRQILAAETGRIITSSTGYDVLKDRQQLRVEASLKPQKVLRIPEEGTYVLSGNEKVLVSRGSVHISKEPLAATLDATKVCFPLMVRRVGEGDWMIPYGMKGRKLVSDLMTDRKMSLFEKRRQLVVTDAQNRIIWLVGLRIDSRVAVGQTTKEVLELRYITV